MEAKNRSKQEKQFEKIFKNLFEIYFLPLKFHAKHFVGSDEVSEDIVQDTFAHLWEIRFSFDFSGSVKSYLFQAIQNKCINYLKHNQVKEKYKSFASIKIREAELFTSDFISQQVAILIEKELSASINKAIAKLPDRCKATFLLSREEGLSNKEISKELGISVKAVERNMTRALSSLRQALQDYTSIVLIIFTLMK
ncbi:MAG: RNA polymerase sigma-70 factor [Bacteroidales bacterium]|nr:RNA polymerase sigma-70 factor [Bacteroidales bacterium]